jgi:hypothetical protein
MAHVKLNVLASSLRQSRAALWAHLRGLLVDVLSQAANSEPTAAGLQRVHAATQVMVEVGDEFCRADSHKLKEKLAEITRDFCANEQDNSESILRSMVSRETWRCVDVNRRKGARSIRAVGKVVDAFFRKTADDSTLTKRITLSGSVFMGYKLAGNPFDLFFAASPPPSPESRSRLSSSSPRSRASLSGKPVWPGDVDSDDSDGGGEGGADEKTEAVRAFVDLVNDQWEASGSFGATQTVVNR